MHIIVMVTIVLVYLILAKIRRYYRELLRTLELHALFAELWNFMQIFEDGVAAASNSSVSKFTEALTSIEASSVPEEVQSKIIARGSVYSSQSCKRFFGYKEEQQEDFKGFSESSEE